MVEFLKGRLIYKISFIEHIFKSIITIAFFIYTIWGPAYICEDKSLTESFANYSLVYNNNINILDIKIYNNNINEIDIKIYNNDHNTIDINIYNNNITTYNENISNRLNIFYILTITIL